MAINAAFSPDLLYREAEICPLSPTKPKFEMHERALEYLEAKDRAL